MKKLKKGGLKGEGRFLKKKGGWKIFGPNYVYKHYSLLTYLLVIYGNYEKRVIVKKGGWKKCLKEEVLWNRGSLKEARD